jgi:UDP-3-O-[3-hydroxymyristoyl] N-acetylglucosamine deacetylase
MAALAGSGIDNAIVEIDGPEVPIMDGSAAPFLHLIERAGAVAQDEPRRAVKILKPVAVSDGDATAALLPDHGFSLSFEIDFANPLINQQDMAVTPDPTPSGRLAPPASLAARRFRGTAAAGLGRGGSLDGAARPAQPGLNHGGCASRRVRPS